MLTTPNNDSGDEEEECIPLMLKVSTGDKRYRNDDAKPDPPLDSCQQEVEDNSSSSSSSDTEAGSNYTSPSPVAASRCSSPSSEYSGTQRIITICPEESVVLDNPSAVQETLIEESIRTIRKFCDNGSDEELKNMHEAQPSKKAKTVNHPPTPTWSTCSYDEDRRGLTTPDRSTSACSSLSLSSLSSSIDHPLPDKSVYKFIKDEEKHRTKDALLETLQGRAVGTTYNDKEYTIIGIVFNADFDSFVDRRGHPLSIVSYYEKRYNIVIRDKHQPLLITNSKRRHCLVPELCYFLDDDNLFRNVLLPLKGRVKFFVPHSQYGFVIANDLPESWNFYFHANDIVAASRRRQMIKDDAVHFDVAAVQTDANTVRIYRKTPAMHVRPMYH